MPSLDKNNNKDKSVYVYNEMTLPLVRFYKQRSLLTEINSNCPTKSVHDYAVEFFEKFKK